MKNVLILGAGGRDFHNYLYYFKQKKEYRVVAFTKTQIPMQISEFPANLAEGKPIPIYDESRLEDIIKSKNIDLCVFSYSDVSYEHVMHIASRCQSVGANFVVLNAKDTMIKPNKPSIAICATRTGAGKSPTTRYVAKYLKNKGYRVGIIRHPMAYNLLEKKQAMKLEKLEDLDKYQCTIEEREDYEPHIRNGFIVYSGIDYKTIIEMAEKDVDVIIWDGGNNDTPFINPNLFLTITDPLRAGDELKYYPSETNLRLADVVLVSKTDSATKDQIKAVESNIKKVNKDVGIIHTQMVISGPEIEGSAVIVEDGPTTTHGGMKYGAAYKFATKHKLKIINPLRYAEGSVKEAIQKYGLKIVPAIGYSKKQLNELETTLNNTPADYVISASPTNLSKYLRLNKPYVQVTYELKQNDKLNKVLDSFLKTYANKFKPK